MSVRPRWNPGYWARRAVHAMDLAATARGLRLLERSHAGLAHDFAPERARRLRAILRYAAREVPYYARVLRAHGVVPDDPSTLTRLPLLSKSLIRRNRADLVSREIGVLPHYAMNTGGSTGEPLEFLVSPHADRIHHAFLYRMLGYEPGEPVIAFDGSSVPADLRARGVFWIPKGPDVPYGRLSFSSLYLTDGNVGRYVDAVLAVRPAILRGYPSFIHALAKDVLARGLEPASRVKGVVLTSEQIHPNQIEAIRRAFATRVILQYGMSEVCAFGYTLDETYAYHLSPFAGLTEVLREDGRHVGIGEAGEIVVTSFTNRAMPFLRYRTGDVAVYGGEERGVVRLARIEGRTQDFVIRGDGQKVGLTALIFGCHYHAFGHIKRWQLHQREPGEVIVRVVRDAGYGDEDEEEIRRNFAAIAGIATRFEYVDDVSLTPRGKSRMIVQELAVA